MVKFELIFVIFLLFVSFSRANDYPDCSTKLEWYPHQQNCSRYYLCHHNYAVLRSCAPGLYFNNESGQCMLPELANCVLKCPAKDDEKNPVFLPNFNDCSKFFLCYNGEAKPWQCANGLLWDIDSQWCNFEELVNCGNRSNETNTPDISITTPPSTTRVIGRGFDCPLVAGPLFFPHPNYCNKYFKCVMGIAYLLDCEHGKEFDIIDGICKNNAICSNRDTTIAV